MGVLTPLWRVSLQREATLAHGRRVCDACDERISLRRVAGALHNTIAALPELFVKALEARDESALKECVNRNFDCRRAIWGVEALGGENGPNLRMINVAASTHLEL